MTPLLLIAEKHLRSEIKASRIFAPWFFYPIVNTIWGATLAASFAIITLSDWNFRGSPLSIVPVVALLVVCVALTLETTEDSRATSLLDVEEAMTPLSLRVVVILVVALGIQTVAFGLSNAMIIPTLTLGLTKAFSRYFTIQTVCSSTYVKELQKYLTVF